MNEGDWSIGGARSARQLVNWLLVSWPEAGALLVNWLLASWPEFGERRES